MALYFPGGQQDREGRNRQRRSDVRCSVQFADFLQELHPGNVVACHALTGQRLTSVSSQQGPCLWCTNQNRCVDKNAYIPSFPYGLCTEWTTQEAKCREPDFNEMANAVNSVDQSSASRPSLGLSVANIYTKMTTCRAYRSCSECLVKQS